MFKTCILLILLILTFEYLFLCYLSWLSFCLQFTGQPSAALIKSHFVPIFSVCILLHCSKRPGWESGTEVLQSSMLSISGISENERDILIKRHMVCYFIFNSYFFNWFSVVNSLIVLSHASADYKAKSFGPSKQ